VSPNPNCIEGDDFDWWEFEGNHPPEHLAAAVKHNSTRQLHVLVLSLKSAPPGKVVHGILMLWLGTGNLFGWTQGE
jgi:hypothetical protein